MHTVQRNLACINRAPLQTLPRQLQAALQQLPHRVLLRATPSTTCTTKIPCVAPAASTACTTKAIPLASITTRRGGSPPPPSLGGDALRFSCALAVYKPPPQQKKAEIAAGVLGTVATWVASTGSRAAGREAQTPRLVGACERQVRGFLGARCAA
jgi:hypothetical protein